MGCSKGSPRFTEAHRGSLKIVGAQWPVELIFCAKLSPMTFSGLTRAHWVSLKIV